MKVLTKLEKGGYVYIKITSDGSVLSRNLSLDLKWYGRLKVKMLAEQHNQSYTVEFIFH